MSDPITTVGDLLEACYGLPPTAPVCMRGFSVYERMKIAGRTAPQALSTKHRVLKSTAAQGRQPALVLEYEPPEHHEGDQR
jgi:hypothetical protein